MSARIMIVEDEVIFALNLQSCVQSLGHTVVANVTSGEAAIRMVEEVQPDLVLMDIRLAGEMDGIEAAEAIRAHPDVPVIFLTAYADEERLARARLVLPFGYLLKPVEERELKVTIEMALRFHETDRQRRRAEEAIAISERNYREIFNASNEAIFVHDIETGAILDVNRSMCEMFGYPREEAAKLSVGDLSQGQPPYDMNHARQWISKAVAEGPQRFEWLAKRKSGELFWGEINLKHGVISGEDRILAFVSDVSERKRAAKETLALASPGGLAGGLAHDLSNILTTILGTADLALDELSPHARARDNVQAIAKASKRAAKLAKEVKASSGKGRFVVEPIDLGKFVEEMVHLLEVWISKNVTVPGAG